MARTSQSNPDYVSRSAISRSQRYQILEKKRSIAATPPCIVTKLVRDKKLATSTNNDVISPLSTASLAISPALLWMEWAQMKELLELTLENNKQDDNSKDDGNGGGSGGGECNEVAAVAAKSTNDNADYSNDDGDDGSGGGGECNDDNYDNNDDGEGKCSPTGKGLYYPNDYVFLDDILMMIMSRSIFLTILDEAACDCNHNRIMGGPQPPGPNATEEEKRSYKGKRKAFTDTNCCKLLTAVSSVDMNVLPQKQVVMDHTGDQFPHIRLMNVAENSPLLPGHPFAEKDTMMLRIGEEANLCNIRVKVLKSCKMQYEVAGDSFYVKVSNLMFQGWTTHSLCCRENEDTLIIPTRAMYLSAKSPQMPFTGEWMGHLLCSHLETCN